MMPCLAENLPGGSSTWSGIHGGAPDAASAAVRKLGAALKASLDGLYGTTLHLTASNVALTFPTAFERLHVSFYRSKVTSWMAAQEEEFRSAFRNSPDAPALQCLRGRLQELESSQVLIQLVTWQKLWTNCRWRMCSALTQSVEKAALLQEGSVCTLHRHSAACR